jgi:hypothetical protein
VCTSQRSEDFSELGDDVEFCTTMEGEEEGGGWRFKGVWSEQQQPPFLSNKTATKRHSIE